MRLIVIAFVGVVFVREIASIAVCTFDNCIMT